MPEGPPAQGLRAWMAALTALLPGSGLAPACSEGVCLPSAGLETIQCPSGFEA